MMTIKEFLGSLGDDREFQLQVAGYKYILPTAARYGRLNIGGKLGAALSHNGIESLYLHQTSSIELTRRGENVVLMTPTASGKSLAYNIPVLECIMDDSRCTALYLFPLKGLEQDQVKNLNELSCLLGMGETAKVYDGDTVPSQRRIIREFPHNVIFTNPDMLHLSILPFHNKWEGFFRSLKFIVIDEVHSYRGVFGSHVAQVFRRLRRICHFYGSSPRFIAASATIADPSGLAAELIGVPFKTVKECGAPSAGKHFFFVSPIESPYTVATRLFVKCLRAGIRTIVFTQARKITELVFTWTLNYAPEFKDRISPYRAGFLPEERRGIEAKLFRGELLGVISTSALELGVDIGGLDCCILCGYPGSVSSTWQRAGRVGRQGEESVVVFIAQEDALDRYFMKHPEEFFEKSHEAAVIDASNRNILKKHLACAAAELPLKRDDPAYDIGRHMPVIDESVAEGILCAGRSADVWLSVKKRPQRDVSIRASGERFSLISENGRQIGELSGWRVFKEAFPGAIYLHRGRQFQVLELDIAKKKAVCKEVRSQYYTQPLSVGKTEIIGEHGRRRFGRTEFIQGALRMTHRVKGYDRKRIFDRVRISTQDLTLPEYVFETEGVWIVIGKDTVAEIESRGFDIGGTLHAVEHAAIACIPLFALCDRGDIGGLSHTRFPDFGLPAIFVYDGHEGGVGLSKRAAEVPGQWLAATLSVIEECPCRGGCPSCVQDSQCGNRNEPLDKEGAKYLLKRWLA